MYSGNKDGWNHSRNNIIHSWLGFLSLCGATFSWGQWRDSGCLEALPWTCGGRPSEQLLCLGSVKMCIGPTWWLTCVYRPQGDDNKLLFLQELRDVRAACHGPWIVLGDFNLIVKAEDKNNDNLNRAMMGRFRRLINDLGLHDVYLHGRKFTWSNQQDSPTLVRLDRVLYSTEWVLTTCCKVPPRMDLTIPTFTQPQCCQAG